MRVRDATAQERPTLEALMWRASLVLPAYRDAFLAHPEYVAVPDDDVPLTRVALSADGSIAGFATVADGSLEALFVEPALHRHGVGRILVADAMFHASGPLRVVAGPEARPFYEACGFAVVEAAPTAVSPGHLMQLG